MLATFGIPQERGARLYVTNNLHLLMMHIVPISTKLKCEAQYFALQSRLGRKKRTRPPALCRQAWLVSIGVSAKVEGLTRLQSLGNAVDLHFLRHDQLDMSLAGDSKNTEWSKMSKFVHANPLAAMP